MKKMNDVILMQYLDGGLTYEERKAVEQALAEQPELQTQLQQLEASMLPYGKAFDQVKMPDLPEDTREWVNHLCETTPNTAQQSKRTQQLKYAAGLALMFGAGLWFGQWQQTPSAMSSLKWVEPIAQYQSLYVKDTIQPLHYDAHATQDVLTKVQKRYGLQLSIPDLTALDKQFKRIQLLEMDGQPVLQLVYADATGNPLALCLVLNKDAFQQEMAPALVKHAAINSLTWQQKQVGISLLGNQSGQTLKQVEQQLAGKPDWFLWS